LDKKQTKNVPTNVTQEINTRIKCAPVAGNDFIWNLGQNKKQNRKKEIRARSEKFETDANKQKIFQFNTTPVMCRIK
jgi:hypothetical protein